MKLSKIKEELAKLLIKMSVVKTDKAVLEYEGEDLVAGMPVYITNEEEERVPAEDGEYVTEDNKVITVANGRVESIVDPIAEVDAEEEVPAEEVVDDAVEEELPIEEEPKEEEVIEEEVKAEEPETRDEEIAKLREEINELYKLVDSILEKIGETRDEADSRLSKLEQMSAARPASEEIEAIKESPKSGSKLDKFLANYGN